MSEKEITMEEVAKHNKADDCWLVIGNDKTGASEKNTCCVGLQLPVFGLIALQADCNDRVEHEQKTWIAFVENNVLKIFEKSFMQIYINKPRIRLVYCTYNELTFFFQCFQKEGQRYMM